MAAPWGESKPGGRSAPLLAAGAGLFLPIGTWAAEPVVGMALGAAETALILAIVLTALYGSEQLSDRAFRLLRWALNRAEPPSPKRVSREHCALYRTDHRQRKHSVSAGDRLPLLPAKSQR